jgi:hypothetical protein
MSEPKKITYPSLYDNDDRCYFAPPSSAMYMLEGRRVQSYGLFKVLRYIVLALFHIAAQLAILNENSKAI